MVSDLPEELLEQAEFLLTLSPNQANLRRAVSTAYYSLFHLLIRDAVLNWNEPQRWARIARMFEHARMKQVSEDAIRGNGTEISERAELQQVAQSFINLQQARHDADYNLEKPFEPADALVLIERAKLAFDSWESLARKLRTGPRSICFLCSSKRKGEPRAV